jgi:hypothetical protein
MVEKSYGLFNLRNLFVDMAVNSSNEISDSDNSFSNPTQVRKKLEQPSNIEQVFLINPNLRWYPIHIRKPDSSVNFRSDFFEVLKKYTINHRDLILPNNTDDLMLDQSQCCNLATVIIIIICSFATTVPSGRWLLSQPFFNLPEEFKEEKKLFFVGKERMKVFLEQKRK